MNYALVIRPNEDKHFFEIYRLSPKGSIKGGPLWSRDGVKMQNLRRTLEDAGEFTPSVTRVSYVGNVKQTVHLEYTNHDLETLVRPLV